MERRVALFLTSAAILWVAAIFFAPAAHAHHLGGRLPDTIRMAGALVCHQRVERSFEIAGCPDARLCPVHGPLPVRRARRAGSLADGPADCRGVPERAILAAAVPTMVTVAVEWAGLMQPGNVVRAVAALPIGAACGWIFVRLLRAEAAPCVIIS